jgi:hypothetical protein
MAGISTIPNLADLDNYVFKSYGGVGSFFYNIEEGVAI